MAEKNKSLENVRVTILMPKTIKLSNPAEDMPTKKEQKEHSAKGKNKGRKTEVYPLEIEEMKMIIGYFEQEEMWLHYLLFVLSCNMARRISDMLALRWENFFYPNTGNFREDILEIVEDKTDKLANPKINSACRSAIELYIKKTGCDVSKSNYKLPVFMQLSGNYKGKVITDRGYLKALKKAAAEVGIQKNIGTHSPRKTFGMISRMLHPADYDSMELLQSIYNHSSTNVTRHYIGLTKKKVDAYYDDMGVFFEDYVVGNKKYKDVSDKPIVSFDTNDLRDIIRAAYEAGKNNAGTADAMIHVDAINSLMQMVENLAK